MDWVLAILVLGILIIAFMAVKCIALLFYAFGFEPPVWLIRMSWMGVPSRGFAALMGLAGVAWFYFAADFLFEIPFIDLIDSKSGVSND